MRPEFTCDYYTAFLNATQEAANPRAILYTILHRDYNVTSANLACQRHGCPS